MDKNQILNRNDFKDENLFSWVYPKISSKNFREYQFNIVKNCLLNNTLVCLPTGLGKTFISSCVIYNFHLWFRGKIFFCAPTIPLVIQQKTMFLKIFKTLSELVIKITGNTNFNKRKNLYNDKKIFFMTPQTLLNDLTYKLFPANEISLIVFDEAHKAMGKYAFNEIMSILSFDKSNIFRVIALSATPGSNLSNIQSMLLSLKINNIEILTESNLKPYMFNKKIEIVEIEDNVDINKLEEWINELIKNRLLILKKYDLIEKNSNPNTFFKKSLIVLREKFKLSLGEFKHNNGESFVSEIYDIFSILDQLIMSRKMLKNQGIESFRVFFEKLYSSNGDCSWKSTLKNKNLSEARKQIILSSQFKNIQKFIETQNQKKINQLNPISKDIKNDFNQYIKHNLDKINNYCRGKNKVLGFNSKSPKNTHENLIDLTDKDLILSSHPKLEKLSSIIEKEKNNIKNNYQVIIFTNFKESAKEITAHLNNKFANESLNIALFTGQDSTFTQADQQEIADQFRQKEIRILVSTSVGEEGLDFGSVDLIICYDIASSSPIQMIQRFGRTGRRRIGKVIILVTKGEEKYRYFKSIHKSKDITRELSNLKLIKESKLKLYSGKDNMLNIPESFIKNVKYIEINKRSFEENSFDSEENLCSDNEDLKQKNEGFTDLRLSDFDKNDLSSNNITSKNENKIVSFQIFNKKTSSNDKKGSNKFDTMVVYKDDRIENHQQGKSIVKKKGLSKKDKKVHFNLNNIIVYEPKQEKNENNLEEKQQLNMDPSLFFHKHLFLMLGGQNFGADFLSQKRDRKIIFD